MNRYLPNLNRASPFEYIRAHRRILRPCARAKHRKILLDNLWRIAGISIQHRANCTACFRARRQQLSPKRAVVRSGCDIYFIGFEIIQGFSHIPKRFFFRVFKHVVFQHSAGISSHFQAVILLLSPQFVRFGRNLCRQRAHRRR